MKQTIVIAGMGLIGGSLAKSIFQSNQHHIVGYDVDLKTLEYAQLNEMIHESTTDFTLAVQQADFIILAAPISETISLLHDLDSLPLKKDVIVTDVASVKTSILETANTLTNEHITFIGGHPMAGSHKKGVEAAKEHLFENAIYVLTPSIRSTEGKIASLKNILKHTNSNFVTLNSNEHDEMTGVISHFPHLIASSLVHQAKQWGDKHTYLPTLAAGGFRDITRIASSNPEMWQDIFYHNKFKMSKLLKDWIIEMSSLKELLDTNDKESMITYLKNAKVYRDGLGEKDKGAIPSFHDLYVDIQDQTGALASVVQLLASKEISIKNIQILEIREGITGALRLSFPTQDLQIQSYHLLQNHGHEVMVQN
ncbi:prephenate dehydrogenase [Virgibacillus natechei]|uniref:Prephenate dehydrogenase n=1 Tax=Virgibacillus natechei TaxID=1216297 RepID=A0ABS4IG98_9BACI|nr:prephenate dehydrogenase [Virgibacillus natechei]MBP1969605.1 prephenate dehydrogenase [Virgibacillus natechei]UZD11336.1 prephenate dehydrogenase [Virgibacillus natechei]